MTSPPSPQQDVSDDQNEPRLANRKKQDRASKKSKTTSPSPKTETKKSEASAPAAENQDREYDSGVDDVTLASQETPIVSVKSPPSSPVKGKPQEYPILNSTKDSFTLNIGTLYLGCSHCQASIPYSFELNVKRDQSKMKILSK